jgi:hypothetical protein
MHLCLIDLVELTGGKLQLAAMPPLEGTLAPIRRIVLSPDLIRPGDVYWRLAGQPGDMEAAFLGGALGVVIPGRPIEPWPGRFSLQVDDPVAALRCLVEHLAAFEEQSSRNSPELKVLQLCAATRVDIPPSACGRSAEGQKPSRCRRQAA